MNTENKLMTRKAVVRKGAMLAILAPVAMLAACSQEPAPPAPVQAAPPPPPPPAPAPVPRARG